MDPEEAKVRESEAIEGEEPEAQNQLVPQVDFGSRDALPYLKNPDDKPSVWKILKDAIGKDLSKFCVPVCFNEPISMV